MTAYLLARYTDVANKYGWWGLRQAIFRLQFWFDDDLQYAIGNARHVRRMFQRGELPVSETTNKVQ